MPLLHYFRIEFYPEGITTFNTEIGTFTCLGYYAASSSNLLQTFRDNLLVPSSGFKNFSRSSQLPCAGSLQLHVVQKSPWEEIIPQAAGYDQSVTHHWDIVRKAWELALSNSHIPQHCGELYNYDLFI